MSIFVKPLARIRQLEQENTRLRALVGEAPVPVEDEEAAPTLVQKTDDLEDAVVAIAEVLL